MLFTELYYNDTINGIVYYIKDKVRDIKTQEVGQIYKISQDLNCFKIHIKYPNRRVCYLHTVLHFIEKI